MTRPLRLVGIPLLGILLVLFFVYRGFPYERLADVLAPQASEFLGARVQIGEVAPWLSLGAPGFETRGVDVRFQDGRTLRLERAAGRPAFSAAWLTGTPALWIELEGPVGTAHGTWLVDRGWQGELKGVDLGELPSEALWSGLVAGHLDADVDVQLTEAGPEGAVRFELSKGSLRLPGLPIALPYEVSRGEVSLGGEAFLELLDFSVEGPMLSATGKGRIGHADRFARAPLELEFQIRNASRQVNQLLASAGAQLSRGGAGRIQVGGTPGAPRLR